MVLDTILSLPSPAVAVGAGGAIATAVAFITHYYQKKRAAIFPVVYSHRDKIGPQDEPALDFYGAVNDMTMSITEAWNEMGKTKSYNRFMKSLHHERFLQSLDGVALDGRDLLEKVAPHVELASMASKVASTLDDSWHYRSHDNYHTQVYYTTESYTDAKGKVKTRRVRRTRQVYDDTDHYFTFYPENARKAHELLDNLVVKYMNTDLYDPGLTRYKIDPTGKDERRARLTVFEDEAYKVTDKELDNIMNQWLIHAGVNNMVVNFKDNMAYLVENMHHAVEVIESSRTSYHYNTTSRSHSGPDGYRWSADLESKSRNASNSVGSMTGPVRTCMEKAGNLRERLVAGLKKGGAESNLKQTAKDALDIGVESYLAAFPGSEINIDQRVKPGSIALISLGVGLLTGILTYFAHSSAVASAVEAVNHYSY